MGSTHLLSPVNHNPEEAERSKGWFCKPLYKFSSSHLLHVVSTTAFYLDFLNWVSQGDHHTLPTHRVNSATAQPRMSPKCQNAWGLLLHQEEPSSLTPPDQCFRHTNTPGHTYVTLSLQNQVPERRLMQSELHPRSS